MTHSETTVKRSRRDQILDTAFGLLSECRAWSLAMVAEGLGITKTALYRHFPSRVAIEEAMDERFRAGLAEAIESADPTPGGVRQAALSLLGDHRGYLGYLLAKVSASPGYEDRLYAYLETASPRVAAFSANYVTLDAGAKLASWAAVFKGSVAVIIASLASGAGDPRGADLARRAGSGLPELAEPDEVRLSALEALAAVDAGDVPEPDRLLAAIARTIRDHGVDGTTVERIAERMGTAKSSLYFYRPNKGAMLGELMSREIRAVLDLVASRVPAGMTLAEQLYLAMGVQAAYLVARPDIVPVFNWIRYQNMLEPGGHGKPEVDLKPFLASLRTGELEVPRGRNRASAAAGLFQWASILATSLVVKNRGAWKSPSDMHREVRALYRSVLRGDKELS